MKTRFIILFILIGSIAGCAVNQEYLTFSSKDQKLILTPKEISRSEEVGDQKSRAAMNFHLTDIGIKKVTAFTQKLVGETITIMFGKEILYDKLSVTTPIKGDIFSIPVKSKEVSHQILHQYK